MKCYYNGYLFVLLLAAVIDQGLCNEAASEQPHHREKRQGPRGQRGPPHRPGEGPPHRPGEGPPHRPGEGPHHHPEEGPHHRPEEGPHHRPEEGPHHRPGEEPHRRPDGHRGPEGHENERYVDTNSGEGDNDVMSDSPMVDSRFAETQTPNLGLGLSLNLGGVTRSPSATTMAFQSLGMTPMTGMAGFGGMPSLSTGLGGSQNAANYNRNGYTRSPVLLNLGGDQNSLINIGGAQNTGLINLLGQPNAGNDNRPAHRDPQGPEPNNHQGNQGPGHNNPQGPKGDRNPPGQQGNNRPSGQHPGRPGGNQNGRPNEEASYVNGRPSYEGNSGQQGSGSSNNLNPGQNGDRGQGGSNNQNSGGGNSQNQGGGGGKKKCRGNQYTCQNRECVARNARCNGITECRDGSDESNCRTSDNRPGVQDGSIDYATTAAPFGGSTTASPTAGGCILPAQPTGGSYELGSCPEPCNMRAGTKVPLSSFLTYRCNEGYTLNGNNVTFCHGGNWYLLPTCVKTCSPLRSNSLDLVCKLHGEIVSCESAIAPGTKATLACKHSYKIPLSDDPAYREVTCLEDGVWDRTLFRCLPECGTAVAHGNTLIVSGFTAKTGVFPWHVGIYQKNSGGSFDQICAGTLISPDLVISAAHCFYDDTINAVQDASNYAVGAGKHYRSYNMPEKYAQKSYVKKIEVATRYYGASGNFAEDISLVRLQTPLTLTTLVRPICMDWDNTYEREQLQNGQSGKAVGWGKTAEGVPSIELQEINLPFIPYQECVSAVPEEFRAYVTADKFCAGYLNGSSLCEGDSGGGLCFQLNGLWYLRGIVSVSPVAENTCDNNYYTAFTNVGRFREWIRAAYVSTS